MTWLASELIEAEVDGHRLWEDEKIYPFLLLLLPAGAETTGRSSSNLLFGSALRSWPAGRGLVLTGSWYRRRSRRRCGGSTLRLTVVARTATVDLELGGVRTQPCLLVAVSLGAANRDPAWYPEPDAFDVFRADKQHMSFGDGAHTCLGMHLARLEMRILLTAVLDRLPGLRLDPGADDPHIHGLLFRSPPNLPCPLRSRMTPPAWVASSHEEAS